MRDDAYWAMDCDGHPLEVLDVNADEVIIDWCHPSSLMYHEWMTCRQRGYPYKISRDEIFFNHEGIHR